MGDSFVGAERRDREGTGPWAAPVTAIVITRRTLPAIGRTLGMDPGSHVNDILAVRGLPSDGSMITHNTSVYSYQG